MIASFVSLPAVLAALIAQVNAHGYMSNPAPTFLSSAGDKTQFIATIESSASGFSGSFNTDPASNTAAFTTAFASSKYSSLKDMITALGQTISGATITCGLTDPSGTPQPLPASNVEWAHSDSEGFTPSHEGPCEIWCDSTRVFQDDDCSAHYKTAPAKLPYDSASCSGASRLTFYWLALHSSTWQAYINCAPLSGSSSAGTTSSSTTSSTPASSGIPSSGTPSSGTTNSTSPTSTSTGTTASTETYTPSTAPSTNAATSSSSTPASSGQTGTSTGATGTNWGWGNTNTKSGTGSNTGGAWRNGNSFGFWG